MKPGHMTRADLANAIAHTTLHSPHTVPLLEAAYRGVMALLAPFRAVVEPLSVLGTSDRAALVLVWVLVGDDVADGSDTGPAGWPFVPPLVAWTRFAVIHTASRHRDDYRAAVLLAVRVRRLVLVETGSRNAMAWDQAFAQAGVSTVNFLPQETLH